MDLRIKAINADMNDLPNIMGKLHTFNGKDRQDAIEEIFEKITQVFNSECSLSETSELTTVFKFLRNFVASCDADRNFVARNHSVVRQAVTSIARLTHQCCSLQENAELQLIDSLTMGVRCGIQFLGNFVANNNENKCLIWKDITPLFQIWLTCNDVLLRKYAAMVLYNCILDVPSHREELLSSSWGGIKIVTSLINCALKNDCEWGLYALENFLEVSDFMEKFYLLLPIDLRTAILDILLEGLNKTSRGSIAIETFLFIAKKFESSADLIFLTKDVEWNGCLEPVEIVSFLEILCLASVEPLYQSKLQGLSSLLCCITFLLKSIHMAGQQSDNYFSRIEELSFSGSESAKDLSKHPAVGFKKNLIRLIANMVWHNRVNQDKIRELDGIPLLLDCCKLDARNQFIIQWVVFAIRNLCENNVMNQEIIANMEQQGVIQSSLVEEFSMQVVLDERDKPVVKPVNSGRTKLEQAQDDIRDLML